MFDAAGRSPSELSQQAERYYNVSGFKCLTKFEEIEGHYDLTMATRWDTAALAMKVNASHRIYLIQDYEAYFNPVGDGSVFAENSYLLGFQPLTYGRWLALKLGAEFGNKPYHFEFTSDTSAFKCSVPMESRLERTPSLVFIYQADKTRRCPRLGIETLGIVNHYRPDVQFYFVGSNQAPDVWYNVHNVGNATIPQLNEIYNRSLVGLSLSSSNPSCNAFDMMAAGLPSVDLYRENNLLDIPSGGVLLAHQTPESIAEAILHLLQNPEELLRRSRYGIDFMASRAQVQEVKEFVSIVETILSGELYSTAGIAEMPAAYNQPPVVAQVNRNSTTDAYLDNQRRLFQSEKKINKKRFFSVRNQAAEKSKDSYYPSLVSYTVTSKTPVSDRFSTARHDRLVKQLVRRLRLDPRLDSRLFDIEFYLDTNPDVTSAGADPLRHFIRFGAIEGRSPSPFFDAKWYDKEYPDHDGSGLSAIARYIAEGSALNHSPNASFDSIWYLSRYPDVRQASLHPLLHYVIWGEAERRNPIESFSPEWYLGANKDVAAAGFSPLRHYLQHGHAEGRSGVPRGYVLGRERWETGNVLIDRENTSIFTWIPKADDHEPSAPRVSQSILQDEKLDGQVSFDVWSTIIHRRCHADEIKLRSARFLLLNAWDEIRPGLRSAVKLMEARMRAENASAPKQDYEYRFAHSISGWLRAVLYPSCGEQRRAELVTLLLEHEFIAEADSIELDENVGDLIRSLRRAPIFISDFYMDHVFLHRLLHSVGIGGYFARGYASCDLFENKRSGALFNHVISDFGLSPSELTHIGDNPISDLQRPLSLGINAVAYVSKTDEVRNEWYTKAFHGLCTGDLTAHQRRILAISDNIAQSVPSDLSDETADGYRAGCRIGLLAFGYCLNVMQDAITRKSKEVVFFAREGILFQKIYDLIAQHDPFMTKAPPSRLLYVSRRSTFAASIRSYDNKEFMRLWTMYWQQSPASFARSLNLDIEKVEAAVKRVGIALEKVIDAPWTDKGFQAFLNDPEFKEYATTAIERQRELLKSYIYQEIGDRPEELLIVDIGWRGTIQDNIAHLLDVPVRGHYLALFNYLNKQPSQSSKVGWLSDTNAGGDYALPDRVAPLEMIFNGEGGSTIGYRQVNDGSVQPIREIFAQEEQTVSDLASCRAGMMALIEPLTRYVRKHGLMAGDFLTLNRKVSGDLLDTPPAIVADIFGRLEHNETFGVGAVDTMVSQRFEDLVRSFKGAELHEALSTWLGSRWPSGMSRQTVVKNWWNAASAAERVSSPLIISKTYSPSLIKTIGDRVSVYIQNTAACSKLRTTANMIKGLVDVGYNVDIYADDPNGLGVVEQYIGATKTAIFSSWSSHRNAAVALATNTNSAQYVAYAHGVHHKFYLIQDNEAAIHPVGSASLNAENSFTLGLHHLTIGNWLAHFITTRFGVPAYPSGFGIDTQNYKIIDGIERQGAVCMHYLPEASPAGDVGLQVLSLVKKRQPDTKIYIFGSDYVPQVDFDFENLGMIQNESSLNELYNKCAVGLSLNLSNPPRAVFEMSAAGCSVVDLYRYNNLMDHTNITSLLTHQSAVSLAEGILTTLERRDADATAAKKVSSSLSGHTLQWESDTLVASVIGLVEGSLGTAGQIRPKYLNQPFIADADLNPAAREFCLRQMNDATAFSKL